MRQRGGRIRHAWIILPVALLAGFVIKFNPNVNQWLVNFTWFSAVALWWLRFWRQGPAPTRWALGREAWWAFAIFAVAFAATWLPFYDNWRWVQAGDGLGYFSVSAAAAKSGLPRSLLSMLGLDENLPYTSLIVDNFLMFLFGPSFFWHRVSKFVVSVSALLSVYVFFSLALGFPWSLAIVVLTSATFNWLNMSHISQTLTDSYICAYLALTMLTLTFRQPERLAHWVALGIVAGLSLYFTQTAWAEVIACGVVLGIWAVARGQIKPLLLCGLSFLMTGLPALLQLQTILHAATRQTRMEWNWAYLVSIFRSILYLPAGGTWSDVGWNGYFAAWPCGYFYLAGLGIGALSAVPAVRRRLGLPAAAAGLLGLFLAEAMLMTVTNNLNSNPSPKRTYHLIPLQAFFGLLPFYTVAAVARGSRLLRPLVAAAAGVAVGAYVLTSASLVIFPERFGFGGNIFDALVQVRQRHPDRKVLVLAPHIKHEIDNPESVFNEVYHVSDTISVTRTIDTDAIGGACAARMLICTYTRPEDREALQAAAAQQQLRRIAVYATGELQCFECL